ncbi:snRNA-activating protein complex subunit 2-like [Lethenteron reissneri]|uniref:snRNA-activating protein complex subunit 2-like n=1 Tax=Lethenteron reissneri TaxID=7753 RepID=UPI002AB6D06F|nr:snRNA-activating protein complex subunit 2-like [Lethenteron reissneri]XP_061432747.1 snRNA-activating protein complex subunit 2-like [Lethenteron reissneri]
MKPPSRQRSAPSRFIIDSGARGRSGGGGVSRPRAWLRREKRDILRALRQRRGEAPASPGSLAAAIGCSLPGRTHAQLEAFLLKRGPGSRWWQWCGGGGDDDDEEVDEERRSPLDRWIEVAERASGSVVDTTSTAFTQVFTIGDLETHQLGSPSLNPRSPGVSPTPATAEPLLHPPDRSPRGAQQQEEQERGETLSLGCVYKYLASAFKTGPPPPINAKESALVLQLLDDLEEEVRRLSSTPLRRFLRRAQHHLTGPAESDVETRGGDAETRGGDAETRGGDAETRGGDAETRGGDAETRGGDAETRGGDAETRGGDAETRGGDAETRGGDAETRGGDAETRGGDAETRGGDAGIGVDTGRRDTETRDTMKITDKKTSLGSGVADGGGVPSVGGVAARGGATALVDPRLSSPPALPLNPFCVPARLLVLTSNPPL